MGGPRARGALDERARACAYRRREQVWRESLVSGRPSGQGASIAIVGAGIIGLSIADAAVRLGYAVNLLHDKPLLESTSAVAGGLIEPVATPEAPEARRSVLDAFCVSFDAWAAIAAEHSRPLVVARQVTGYRREASGRPDWADIVEGYHLLRKAEIPASLSEMTWAERFGTFVVDPKPYMAQAVYELQAAGATFTTQHVTSLSELLGSCDAVINATGIGAAALVGDQGLYRCDGHVITVPRPASFSDVVFDWDFGDAHKGDILDFIYVIGRPNDVVVGGTLREGATIADGEPAREHGMAERLLAAGSGIVPEIVGPILTYSAASRPMREAIRVECERMSDGTPLVHCYGTGGSGWTLAPGLARQALEALAAVVPPPLAASAGPSSEA
jgi:D-amino-acid oxidase